MSFPLERISVNQLYNTLSSSWSIRIFILPASRWNELYCMVRIQQVHFYSAVCVFHVLDCVTYKGLDINEKLRVW